MDRQEILDRLRAFPYDRDEYWSAQGTVLCALGQPLLNLRIIPVLIPVSLEACRIDTPPFSTFRSAGSCSTQRTVPCVPQRTVPCVPEDINIPEDLPFCNKVICSYETE